MPLIPSPSSASASFGSLSGAPGDNAALASALAAKLALAGGTMTGQLINSTNGAASTPALLLSGTPFTGGTGTTTKPLALIETAGATSTGWNTSGTMLGVNAPSGFAGRFADFQVNGVSKAYVTEADGFVAASFSSTGTMTFNPGLGSAGAYLTLDANVGSIRSIRAYNASFYTIDTHQFLIAGTWGNAADVGFARTSAGVGRISDGSTGRGTLDAAGYQVGGVAGADGTFTTTDGKTVTVSKGIITSIV